MFNNNKNIFGGQQQQQQQQQQQNNIFGGNNNNPNPNNVFNTNQGQNNMFGNKNTGQQGNPANNIFGQTTPNTQNNPIFGQPNQGNQGNNMFNQPNNAFNQGANNAFAQNNQQTNAFNQQPNQGNTGIFAQGNQNQGNIFGQNTQAPQGNAFNTQPNQQGIFAQPNQQNTMFGQNTQGTANRGIFNQNPQQTAPMGNFTQPVVGAGNNPQGPFFQAPMNYFNLMTFTPEQQQRIIHGSTNEHIRKYIEHCLKSLIDPKRLEGLSLSSDNTLRNEKTNKLAGQYNIKKEILYVKKEVKDKIVSPLNDLKAKDKALVSASSELAFKVSQKLQRYKEKLIEAISEKKMIEDVKRQLDQIDSQIKDFLKPLFNSHQTRSSFSFIDPDQFCIRVSEQILKNIAYLDNKMDELLACQGEVPQEAVDTGDIIELLVQYYENVVISLRQFTQKYQKQKKEVLTRRRVGNIDETLRRIVEKANVSVGKELKAYELVKQIQTILQAREKRSSGLMMAQ